jgi:hypothetical protein
VHCIAIIGVITDDAMPTLIVCILKRRQKIGKIQHDHYETFLVYLVILLLTNANDIHLNPGLITDDAMPTNVKLRVS